MRPQIDFPYHGDSTASTKIADLKRLSDRTLTDTQYIDGASASRLLGVFLSGYRDFMAGIEADDLAEIEGMDGLAKAKSDGRLFGLALAAAFDLICNAEYLHGRVVNSKWIYCHRPSQPPRAYYSFLKQCPSCCLTVGLGPRLNGAQHKPTSHHIGEITTVGMALLLQLIAAANAEPFDVATVTKQSHDVDAIGFREDLLVLFEIKASPMVSFPLVMDLEEELTHEVDGIPTEHDQHALVDVTLPKAELSLDIPHRGWSIPLGSRSTESWPYGPLIDFFTTPSNAAQFLAGWVELFDAYRIPKTTRTGRQKNLAYLVNGFGDEIDSNKTKPGLGRTDDIKKGTYQLLKFGAYYRDDNARTAVRGALVANLDPLFLRANYVDGLVDVRWGHEAEFRLEDGEYRIAEHSLRHLYDGLVTFNDPVLNDPLLKSLFDLPAVEAALTSGHLDELLNLWCELGPDVAVAEIAAEGKPNFD